MPLSAKEVAELEELEALASEGLDPDSDSYDDDVDSLNQASEALDNHYKLQRKVDHNGKLTEDAATRTPSSVEGNDPQQREYFFEPSVREVQDFLRRDRGATDRLGLRRWAEGIAEPEKREAVLDSMSGMPQGYNVVPAKTFLDTLETSDDPNSPYRKASDELWKQRMEEAQRSGRSIKRYRDVKVDESEWGDWVAGGINKGMDRIVAPTLMGAADAMTMGQAAPLGDALTDLADYELGKRGINLEDIAGRQPRSREVINRNMPAYVVGNFAGYGLPNNPTNLIQGGLANAANYAERGVGGRLLTSGVAGGAANVLEGGMNRLAQQASVEPTNESFGRGVGNIVATAAQDAPVNLGVGAAGGAVFDAVAQGISHTREGYRDLGRNAPLRTAEEAGAEASIPLGVKPSEEIGKAYDQQKKDRLNEKLAPRTVAGQMAENLAPDIKRSVEKREVANQERVGKQMEEYYAHPDYRDRKVSARPAVEGLLDMARRGIGRAPDDSMMPMNPGAINEIGEILRSYSRQGTPVPRADAPAIAHATNGVVVEGELANQLYGLKEGDAGYHRPGFDAVVRPGEINAEQLTVLEQRIDDELKFAQNKGAKDDPVWNRFNERVKAMRDDFPLYRDAEGNLVPPPPESARPEPFAPADDLPRPPTTGHYMAPPVPVGGPAPQKPQGLMGVGPGQPSLPSSPFDPRAGRSPGGPADQLPRPIGIGGEGMVAQPEGLYGVGPGGPPIPENPFDPRLPTSREAINPQPTMSVQGDISEPNYVGPEAIPGVGPNYQPPNDPRRLGPPVAVQGQFDMGGEYGPPPPLDPNARQGLGPPRRFEQHQPVEPQPTQSVQGTYNLPPEVKMEPAPITERGMPPAKFRIMVMEDGKPRPVAGMRDASSPEEAASMVETLNSYGTDEFSAEQIDQAPVVEQRNPLAPSNVSEESLSTLAGNKLAMKVDEPFNSVPPTDAQRIEPRQSQDISPEERAMQQHEIDEFLRKDKEMNAPSADERGGLEKMLDEQLPSKPPVTEIEEAGALQTADREQVAQNQKDYLEEHFAPGREARAAQMEQVRALGEHPEIIQEAIEAVKKVDERLGPIPQEQKRTMVVKMIEDKLGRKIDAEDLIRFGLISAGLVEMSTDDDNSGAGAAAAGIGMFGFGRGKGPKGPAGPERPAKPTQPEYVTEKGERRRGFSAMRAEQHESTTAVERAMKRLGVDGDTTLENRIRTYGQLDDRGKVDQALLDEASNIGKQRELRNAAGANAYDSLRDRRFGLGNEGIAKGLLDFFGFRGYAASEYFAGRHQPNTPPGDDGMFRNPYVREPSSLLGEMQRTLLEDPARRLLNLSGGTMGARFGDDAFKRMKGDSVYESKEESEKKQQQKRNKEKHP